MGVPAGPQVLRVQRLGFAPRRIDLVVPATGTLSQDVGMAASALQVAGIRVVADPAGRARGEAGTASVIEREAIRSQVAASLAGVLELIPGVVLQPPGLDGIQQLSLRASPISGGSAILTDADAGNLSAFGTLLVVDGVPLSNNANLQSLGSRSEVNFGGTAGVGIDLRRIPATTIERVEVLRGVPSARWGDLTHGAVIVDTRAGVVEPELLARVDARTTEVSFVAGRDVRTAHAVTITSNFARTETGGGVRGDQSSRLSGQLAHRWSSDAAAGPDARIILDTRVDGFRLTDDRPETPTLPGSERFARDAAFRVLERAQFRLGNVNRLSLTAAYERGSQGYESRRNLVRGVQALTTRTEPGREIGRFEGGIYNATVRVDGQPSFMYSRAELSSAPNWFGLAHDARVGLELRRENNSGAGTQFDLLFPPQVAVVGARGFDRPRSFDTLPSYALSSAYIDDRVSFSLPGGSRASVQAGLRVDALHEPGRWAAAPRSTVWQPRLNAELAVTPWLSLRSGFGRLAKAPSMGSLNPIPDYYDVVNVNYFANAPTERLAALTTYILDPTNTSLRHTVQDRAELGAELRAGGAQVSLVLYTDRLTNGLGVQPEPAFVLRDNYQLSNVNPGSGTPPVLVEPPVSQDSIPVIISRAANNIQTSGSGIELTADLPEIAPLRTRLALQAAFARSSLEQDRLEFTSRFADFQLLPAISRIPYFESFRRTGELGLITGRLIHHQPEIGLIVTGTVQYTAHEKQQNVGDTDSLAFAGYLTRGGTVVPVPRGERGDPQYADLQVSRGTLTSARRGQPDWLLSLQVAKTLPLNGRFSFYAFNAFDRLGRFGTGEVLQRQFAGTRFGVELSMPLGGLAAWR